MTEASSLNQTEKLLLMAAAALNLGPDTDLRFANTGKVIRLALRWAGHWNRETNLAWRNCENNPAIDLVFETLVRMTHQVGTNKFPERSGEVLFEGQGNWGSPEFPPAHPAFTSCRLTVPGQELARTLLPKHPDLRTE